MPGSQEGHLKKVEVGELLVVDHMERIQLKVVLSNQPQACEYSHDIGEGSGAGRNLEQRFCHNETCALVHPPT